MAPRGGLWAARSHSSKTARGEDGRRATRRRLARSPANSAQPSRVALLSAARRSAAAPAIAQLPTERVCVSSKRRTTRHRGEVERAAPRRSDRPFETSAQRDRNAIACFVTRSVVEVSANSSSRLETKRSAHVAPPPKGPRGVSALDGARAPSAMILSTTGATIVEGSSRTTMRPCRKET